MYMYPQRQLLGVRIDDLSLQQALNVSETWLRDRGFHHVVTPGPEFLLEATAHEAFRAILNQSDLSIPDGMGIKVGFGVSGIRHRHRIAGVDYVLGLMRLAAGQHRSVFLLGAKPGVGERAASALLRDYPGLTIAGVESGERWPWTPLSDRRIVERIHHSKPDILLVALGAPKQELWIAKHRAHLHDVSIAVGVGRTFDYLAGLAPRAPAVIRRFGFEWLYTWVNAGKFHEPQRRRRRVWNATWTFFKTIITQ